MPFILVFTLCMTAFCTAQTKLDSAIDLGKLRIGITLTQLEKIIGKATASDINQLTYIFQDGSELKVKLTEGLVSGAVINYKKLLKLEKPEELTFLQVNARAPDDHQGWFYVGKPRDGQIYKVNSEGKVQSLTLVPPFEHKASTPKHFQALIQNFQNPDSPRL
ncbi:MAG TPA: hypothetical protein VNJ01_10315 [Bacteriovoracaceae bacterium]|nr:hypothetical protein [Bacteriovoracaceae bacterium]